MLRGLVKNIHGEVQSPPGSKATPSSSAKGPSNRPAGGKSEDETKAKMTKQIPDWECESLFQHLNETHHENLKAKSAEWEERHNPLILSVKTWKWQLKKFREIFLVAMNEGRGITVSNLYIRQINYLQEFHEVIQVAQKHRMVAATNFNEYSSRSHAIYKIYLYGSNERAKCSYLGSVNLVDLAGSERATHNIGDRLAETRSINSSFSALGNMMMASYNKEKHIPYRNSKLTY
ncbi:hypothetical protein JTB14_014282 [Gonioctena quinquepunctata]|nr:hypothetical protein JTB14_014282 [Gonioctena quinquepunctata]